jgi:hypothetical protein
MAAAATIMMTIGFTRLRPHGLSVTGDPLPAALSGPALRTATCKTNHLWSWLARYGTRINKVHRSSNLAD